MDFFRQLTKARQVTEYSCGACSLQAVLAYWGRPVDERELMQQLETSEAVGTYPEDLVRVAGDMGFRAAVKENVTLDELAAFTRDGRPVIALLQGWRSSGDATPVEEDWSNGHWVVVLGVDATYVYFQDPYARMSKAFVPRETFEAHWHQAMGGDLEASPRLVHLGVFIDGGQRPSSVASTAPATDLAHAFDGFGSLQLLVMRFAGFLLPYDFMTELKPLFADDSIRPNAFILVRKDEAGGLSGIEGTSLQDDEELAAMNALLAVLAARRLGGMAAPLGKAEAARHAASGGDFGLSLEDLQRIGDLLEPDQSALILLLENVWERKLKAIAARHSGSIVDQELVTAKALAAAASALVERGE